MVYDPQTPYTILQNSTIDFVTMQRINRFARYWEMVANSGRFSQVLSLLLRSKDDMAGSAFYHFLTFSDWLWRVTGKTHEFALEKLVDLLFEHLTAMRGLLADEVSTALLADYRASGARGKPDCLATVLNADRIDSPGTNEKRHAERQGRHVRQQQGENGQAALQVHREAIKRAAAAA